MTAEFALACWERALQEEIGVVLTLEDIKDKRRIENILYDTRKAANNPALEALLIARPGDAPLELWIMKKATDMEDVR